MSIVDIRPMKAAMREHYKQLRRDMSSEQKQAMDRSIARRVTSLWQYKRCRVLLTYVSTAIEVDTIGIIQQAWADGKRVAVPRCVPGTRDMQFFFITDMQDLEPGMFGVLEPIPDRCEEMTDFSEGLCLVPALCYDFKGYRLGYGKGYYDRFLARFEGDMIGIEYSNCVKPQLPHGRFDRPVSLLVTDRYLRRTDDLKRSGSYAAKRKTTGK